MTPKERAERVRLEGAINRLILAQDAWKKADYIDAPAIKNINRAINEVIGTWLALNGGK